VVVTPPATSFAAITERHFAVSYGLWCHYRQQHVSVLQLVLLVLLQSVQLVLLLL
jgi:hypothetical protein